MIGKRSILQAEFFHEVGKGDTFLGIDDSNDLTSVLVLHEAILGDRGVQRKEQESEQGISPSLSRQEIDETEETDPPDHHKAALLRVPDAASLLKLGVAVVHVVQVPGGA